MCQKLHYMLRRPNPNTGAAFFNNAQETKYRTHDSCILIIIIREGN